MKKTFGLFVNEKRIEKQITLRNFSCMIDISPEYLSKIENGLRAAPNDEVLERIATSIDNTNDLLHKKEIELNDIKYKLANQQNAMGKLDFYYSQFRTWADEFDNSTMEQKKMIACQLIREVKVSRGYEIEIVFDLNYEQFISQ